MSTVTATLAERDGTVVAELSTAFAMAWRDQRNDVGTGTVSVDIDDPVAADLADTSRIVVFRIDGAQRFSALIETAEQTTIAAGEESEQAMTIVGRGTLAIWEESTLDPENGVNRVSPPSAKRVFGPQSRHFDHSDWIAATQIKKLNQVPPFQWNDTEGPTGWPDPVKLDPYWIWSRPQGGGSPPQPVGSSPFVRRFTVANQGTYGVIGTADDGLAPWLDGEILFEEIEALIWGQTFVKDVFLDAGEHILYVKGTNIERDSVATNIAGVILAVAAANPDGSGYGSPIVWTDADWVCLDYPDPWPSMTPGEVVRIILEEAQARGELTAVSLDFDDDVDSAGHPWAQGVDLVFDVGTSYLRILKTLAETAVDLRMDLLELKMWNKPHGSSVGLVSFDPARNVRACTHSRRRAPLNTALVRRQDGYYFEADDTAAIAAAGGVQRRGFLQLGTADSPDQADRQIEAIFDEHADPRDTVIVDLEPGAGETPYANFSIFDTINAPAFGGGDKGTRVHAIAVAHDELGQALFRIEGRQE